mmetsp:Transcript_24359/g.56631  ORF Transcript_24359/g.56631 Transcript_24359/m.56631 type:complete len:239 (-) Transcript_24359:5-721(-)
MLKTSETVRHVLSLASNLQQQPSTYLVLDCSPYEQVVTRRGSCVRLRLLSYLCLYMCLHLRLHMCLYACTCTCSSSIHGRCVDPTRKQRGMLEQASEDTGRSKRAWLLTIHRSSAELLRVGWSGWWRCGRRAASRLVTKCNLKHRRHHLYLKYFENWLARLSAAVDGCDLKGSVAVGRDGVNVRPCREECLGHICRTRSRREAEWRPAIAYPIQATGIDLSAMRQEQLDHADILADSR